MVYIPEFNTLIAISHKYATPVHELQEEQLLTFGKALNIQKENINKFKDIFNYVAKCICKLAKTS